MASAICCSFLRESCRRITRGTKVKRPKTPKMMPIDTSRGMRNLRLGTTAVIAWVDTEAPVELITLSFRKLRWPGIRRWNGSRRC